MKSLISKYFTAAFAALILLTVTGAWLTGLFEPTDQVDDVSQSELVVSFLGFVVLVGGLIGIVLLIRHNMKPWTADQVSEWRHIREQGRSVYVRHAIIKGLIFASVALAFLLLIDYWKTRSLRLILDSVWIYGAIYLVYVFGSYYAASRFWNANEKHYQNRADSAVNNTPPPT